MGGGGDGGAAKRQAEAERKKQQARNSLNAMFGVAPDSAALAAANASTPGLGPIGSAVERSRPQNVGADLGGQAAENAAARESLYGKVREDAFTAGRRGIDEGAADAARRLKFALFDSGLAGGSVDVDENALLQRTLSKGLLDLGGRADAAAADLRGSDEQTRLGLLQAIDAGTDQGSALSSALNQMKVNADKAAATAQGTNLGDLFGNAGLLYDRRLREIGKTAAQRDYGTATRGAGSYQGTLSVTGG